MSEHELWNELGNLYFLSGAYEPAIHAYTRSIQLDEGFGRPYSNLALVYVHQGKYDQAIELYRRSIEMLIDPQEKAVTWHRLGNVYRHQKDYHMAVDAYQKSDELNLISHAEREEPGGGLETPLTMIMPPLEMKSLSVGSESVITGSASSASMENEPTRLLIAADIPQADEASSTAETTVIVVTPLVEQAQPALESNEVDPGINDSGIESGVITTEEEILPEPDNRMSVPPDWIPDLVMAQPECPTEETRIVLFTTSKYPLLIPAEIQDVSIPQLHLPAEEETIDTDPDCLEEPATGEPLPASVIDYSIQANPDPEQNGISTASTSDTEEPATNLNFSSPENRLPSAAVKVSDNYSDSKPVPVEEESSIAQETEIAELQKIIETNPQNAMAWDALGGHHKTNGNYQDAIVAYEHAISIETKNASFYYHLGLVYAATERHEDAIKLFRKVIELDSGYSLAHATLGGYYRRMGLNELARHHLNKAFSNTIQDENEYNRACLEAICGNTDRALEFLEIALQNQQSYASWALHDPDLDFIRNDPRFQMLISAYPTKVNHQ